VYHTTWTATLDNAVDVAIVELPIYLLFVPDPKDVPDGARGLIARTLAVDASLFDVVVREPPAA
jgi:hypothetical protein